MQKVLKRFLSIVMMVVLLSGSCVVLASNESNLSDVKKYYPFSNWAVDTGKEYGLIFLENNRREVKRWEIVNILYNITDFKSINDEVKRFNDLGDVSDEIKRRIEIISSNQIVLGYEDGSFKPFANVTRAEFVTMLDRTNILVDNITNGDIVFYDTNNHWAEKSINKVTNLGIVTGRGNNSFCPEDCITPQEILIILDRLVDKNYIARNTLQNTMLDTFKCKKYSEEEKYLVEVIYSKFDEVQKDINFYWPLNELYNPINWEGQATYRDLAYAIYFNWGYGANYNELYEKEKSRMDYIKQIILEAQGLSNTDENLNKEFTLRNLIYAISYHLDSKYEINFAERYDKLKFVNLNTMTTKEKKALSVFAVPQNKVRENMNYDKYNIIENLEYIFPLDATVTRYMLNYFINRMCIFQEPYYNMGMEYVCDFFNLETFAIETDINKMPNNYYDYQFIAKGIPKEYYEIPFIPYQETFYVYKPKECYNKYGREFYEMQETIVNLYNKILNVDYNTINEEEFFKSLEYDYMYMGVVEPKIRDYVRYVIDNKIILKGKACMLPGATTIKEYAIRENGGDCYVRICIQFEIVSSNTNKNLILGDCDNKQDVIYNSKSYSFCFDKELAGLFGGGHIAILKPLVREVYFNNNTINEL